MLSRDNHGIFYQGPTMTRLIKGACDDYPWDFVVPLDCDEFVSLPGRAALEALLADLDGTAVGLMALDNYIPTANDDLNEKDVPRRIVHRAEENNTRYRMQDQQSRHSRRDDRADGLFAQ